MQCIFLARFVLEKGYPSLWLFDSGGKNHVPYDGPKDLESLVEFVNTHTGKGPPNVKVYKCKVVSDISMKSILNCFEI